jgi:hypothetical protein
MWGTLGPRRISRSGRARQQHSTDTPSPTLALERRKAKSRSSMGRRLKKSGRPPRYAALNFPVTSVSMRKAVRQKRELSSSRHLDVIWKESCSTCVTGGRVCRHHPLEHTHHAHLPCFKVLFLVFVLPLCFALYLTGLIAQVTEAVYHLGCGGNLSCSPVSATLLLS